MADGSRDQERSEERLRLAVLRALGVALVRYGYVPEDDLPGLPLADALIEALGSCGHVVTAADDHEGEDLERSDETQWFFPIDSRADVIFADGKHRYWSTHCRHGRHDACAATELAPGVPRRPAQCKTCTAPCLCHCHKEGNSDG